VEAIGTLSSQQRLSALDASYLFNESAANPLHVGVALIFEGQIPFDDIKRWVRERVHRVPRFAQRLAGVPFDLTYPAWEDDPDFDLNHHLKRIVLSPGIDQRPAIRRLLREYHPALDRSRPLWAFLCCEGWPGDRTAVVCKVHHALADGAAGVRLVKRLFDFSPEALPPEPPPQRQRAIPPSSTSRSWVDTTHNVAGGVMKSFTDAMLEAVRAPTAFVGRNWQLQQGIAKIAGPGGRQITATPWNSFPLSGLRDLVWFQASFAEFKSIRDAFGVSTGDVLLTVLTEGAARYLKHHGFSPGGWFRLACPVNVRQREEQADCGNRVSMLFPTLPACPMDPIESSRSRPRRTTESSQTNCRPWIGWDCAGQVPWGRALAASPMASSPRPCSMR
jgi:diacylglycerol O-acyltransferase / wax synthase